MPYRLERLMKQLIRFRKERTASERVRGAGLRMRRADREFVKRYDKLFPTKAPSTTE
jgi:hypothetical protein